MLLDCSQKGKQMLTEKHENKNWKIWGENLVYKNNFYGHRFLVRGWYDKSRLKGWAAEDMTTAKWSNGHYKKPKKFKNIEDAKKYVEDKLKELDKKLKDILPELLKPVIKILAEKIKI